MQARAQSGASACPRWRRRHDRKRAWVVRLRVRLRKIVTVDADDPQHHQRTATVSAPLFTAGTVRKYA
jgi:hypothetical protein